jgi:uncharacterized circularly permuted ATP-grasp superfamily protein
MDPTATSSLFAGTAADAPAELASALAQAALAGHFDELRGTVAAAGSTPDNVAKKQALAPAWHDFFERLGLDGLSDLNRRTVQLERQIRDNGVTYNVYADSHGPQRPWSLDLFPMVIDAKSWQQVEAGVLQRVGLLEKVLDDVYGAQTLLQQGLLPPALVQGHPGYLRAMRGVTPLGGTHLHVAAFDLARMARR